MKLSSANYLVKKGVTSVWKNRMMSFASFCIMLVSLLMVGLSVLLALNINQVIDSIASKNEAVVIVKDSADEAAITTLGNQIKEISNVSKSDFYSKDQAWADMTGKMDEKERDALTYAEGDNPLPNSYRVSVKDIEQMNSTINAIEILDNVDSIKAPSEYTDFLISIRNVFALISITIIVALIVVCLVIISNTTRTSVFSRRKEINIMKYVGATNKFIKIPFLIEGTLIGILAAVAAFVVTMFVYDGLAGIFQGDVQLWSVIGMNSMYSFKDIIVPVGLSYLGAGVVIGAIGTSISTSKYVKV